MDNDLINILQELENNKKNLIILNTNKRFNINLINEISDLIKNIHIGIARIKRNSTHNQNARVLNGANR
jgi:hypothetical protein